MIDGCGRKIDHLRLSLTDRCNLACRYCVPGKVPLDGRTLDPDFAFALVGWLSDQHGVSHVRLTGGEPLLYPHLVPLIRRLATLPGLEQITLTTNGQALAAQAASLVDAGLSRINISLDTLEQSSFESLTRGGDLGHTTAGVEAAIAAGLTPVKVNVVVQRGFNDREIPNLAEWGLSRGCIVRFLEVMPIGPLAHVADQHLVPASEVLERLASRFDLSPIPQSVGQPSTDYAAIGRGLRGVIGIIAATTKPFCDQCRRIRVTADGAMVACLHHNESVDLTPYWDGHVFDTHRANAVLRQALINKPAEGPRTQALTMLALGG